MARATGTIPAPPTAEETEGMHAKLRVTHPEFVPATESEPKRLAVLTCMADVEPCEVPWLWHERIALGRLSLVVGNPGEGKSFATLDMAARVSTGTPWPDGAACERGSVILVSAEDDPADTIRPRLDAMRADVHRIHLLSGVRRSSDDGDYERCITLADLDAVRETLDRVPDCRLLVLDPIGSLLGGNVDSHRDSEVRSVLAPVAALARERGVAVVVVAHRRKSAGFSADESAMGSRAFTGLARCVWHISRDAEDRNRRLMLGGKNNLAAEGTGLAFRIQGDPPQVIWEPEPVAMRADDALEVQRPRAAPPGPKPTARDECATWLAAELAGGPRLANELAEKWRDGLGGSSKTLRTAREHLAISAYRPANPGPWYWRLPAELADAPVSSLSTENALSTKQLGHLGHVLENTGILTGSGGGKFPDAPDAPIAGPLEELGHLPPEADGDWGAISGRPARSNEGDFDADWGAIA